MVGVPKYTPLYQVLLAACQHYGICGTKTAKVTWYFKKFVALLQTVKTCKVHRVNKFGQRLVGIALPPAFCLCPFYGTDYVLLLGYVGNKLINGAAKVSSNLFYTVNGGGRISPPTDGTITNIGFLFQFGNADAALATEIYDFLIEHSVSPPIAHKYMNYFRLLF